MQTQRLFRCKGDLSFVWPNIDSPTHLQKKKNPKTNVGNLKKNKIIQNNNPKTKRFVAHKEYIYIYMN